MTDDLAERAARFSADLLTAVRDGSDLTAMTADLDGLGAKATAVVTRAAAAASATTSRTRTAQVAQALTTLQTLAADLTPTADLSDPATADRYFDRYRRIEGTLAGVLDTLRLGREQLERDDARLAETQTDVSAAVTALTRYATLAAGIDEHLAAAATTGPADQTRQDLLFSVRQRRQDLLTQTAVADQLLASLAITRQGDAQLVAAVRRAVDCTVAALGAAVTAADAVASRRLVLDQIAAAHEVTAATVRATAAVRNGTGTSLDLDHDAAATTAELTAAFHELDAALTTLDHTVTASTDPATTGETR
jgi:hypothetical protein